jgi:transposase-like protein
LAIGLSEPASQLTEVTLHGDGEEPCQRYISTTWKLASDRLIEARRLWSSSVVWDTPMRRIMLFGVTIDEKAGKFTDEFKKETVRLILESGKTVAEIGRDLDLSGSAVAIGSVRPRSTRAGSGQGELTTAERQELQRRVCQARDLRHGLYRDHVESQSRRFQNARCYRAARQMRSGRNTSQ